jgi:two-component system OmpR family sensor kinase
MRSASGNPKKRRASLARRIGWANVAAATLGAAVAAAVFSALATQLLLDEEKDLQLRAAERLAEAILPESDKTAPVPEQALEDELENVDLPNPRARIDRADQMVVGDSTLPQPPIGECARTSDRHGAARACSVAFEDGVLVLSMSTVLGTARSTILGWSAVVGLLVAAALGGVASLLLTAWGLRPLSALRKRITLVSPDSVSPALLEPEMEHRELEQVRSAIAALVQRLGQALEGSRRFSSRVAHELRTPLTTISGELELLTEATKPVQHAALIQLQQQVANLVLLVERLLILADRTTVGEGQTLDLADVADAAVERLSPADRGRLQTQIAEDVLVRGDGPLLRVLVSNALENALKFSTANVLLRVEAPEGPCIVVEDEGPGIDPEELADVAEHLQRGRSALQSGLPGHGVGLTLMDHIARIHGGELHLQRREPHGTRVDIHLPAWRPMIGSNDR